MDHEFVKTPGMEERFLKKVSWIFHMGCFEKVTRHGGKSGMLYIYCIYIYVCMCHLSQY